MKESEIIDGEPQKVFGKVPYANELASNKKKFDRQGAIRGGITMLAVILSIVLAIFIPNILEAFDVYPSELESLFLQYSVGSVLVLIISFNSIVDSAKRQLLAKLK